MAVGAIVGAGLAWLVWKTPLQCSDSLLLMVDALGSRSAWAFGWQHADSGAFFRPLYWTQVKWLMDWPAVGSHAVPFKALHVGLIGVMVWLFVRLLNVRTRADVLALPLACTVLVGSHTFLGLAREAFPVNHYLEIVIACLVVANIALAERPRLIADVAAGATLVVAMTVLETGLLVWVCLVVGYLSGARGVSRRGITLATLVLLAYVAVRLAVVGLPIPGLTERSSGFGLERLDPSELVAQFGAHPWLFYLYNVVCSILTVALGEPRAGEWMFLSSWMRDDVPPWMWINIISSLLLLALTASWLVRRPTGPDGPPDRFEAYVRAVFPAVTLVNAVICYSYTKDVLMAPAGVFAAAAAYCAARRAAAWVATLPVRSAALVVSLLLVMSSGWAVRAAGFYYNMRDAAFLRASEWALVDQWLAEQHVQLHDAGAIALVEELRARAIEARVPNPQFAQPWLARYVDRGQR